MSEKGQVKDYWDKFEVICKIVGVIAVPIVLGVFGYNINSTLKDRELRAKYVEIAVGVLSQPPTEETKALREWAVDLLQANSAVRLTENAIKELYQSVLPTRYLTTESGEVLTTEDGELIIIE